MASKKVEFHEDAALEYEAAFEWYLEPQHFNRFKICGGIQPSHGYDCGGASTLAYGQ